MHCFQGETADDVWQQVGEKLKTNSSKTKSRAGNTSELLHVVLEVNNPIERWVTSRVPPISIGFALADLIWILIGSNNADVINFWNPALKNFAGSNGVYYGAYGERIRKSYNFDQLVNAFEALKHNPDSRQVVITIWNPNRDFPDNNGKPRSEDIPCNICSLLKIRDGRLEWTQIMRSNDVLLGLPYNFIQFTSLQEILAGWLNIEVGTYCHFSDSLHLYEDQRDTIGFQRPLGINNSDDLKVSKERFDLLVNLIYKNMEIIAYNDVNQSDLLSLSELKQPEESYCNIMRIICVYAANKLGFKEVRNEILSRCSNELYTKLWINWLKSKED